MNPDLVLQSLALFENKELGKDSLKNKKTRKLFISELCTTCILMKGIFFAL